MGCLATGCRRTMRARQPVAVVAQKPAPPLEAQRANDIASAGVGGAGAPRDQRRGPLDPRGQEARAGCAPPAAGGGVGGGDPIPLVASEKTLANGMIPRHTLHAAALARRQASAATEFRRRSVQQDRCLQACVLHTESVEGTPLGRPSAVDAEEKAGGMKAWCAIEVAEGSGAGQAGAML